MGRNVMFATCMIRYAVSQNPSRCSLRSTSIHVLTARTFTVLHDMLRPVTPVSSRFKASLDLSSRYLYTVKQRNLSGYAISKIFSGITADRATLE